MKSAVVGAGVVFVALLTPARTVVWRVLCTLTGAALALLAALVEHRRSRRRSSPSVPASGAWRVVIYYVGADKRMRQVAATDVRGHWRTSADVEREALTLWIQHYGHPHHAKVACRATPL